MIIGAVVEELIYIRDKFRDELTRSQDEAICEACILMDRLPRMEEAMEFEPVENRVVRPYI